MAEIARFDERDWAVYRDIRLAALAEAPYAFASRLEDERDHTEAQWRERLELRVQFVARQDGLAVGTVGCWPEEDGTMGLISMWVAPAARGAGIGGLLVDAVVLEARAQACLEVAAWVSDGNDRAERLYARCGFARSGRVQMIDDDRPERGSEFEMRRVDPAE